MPIKSELAVEHGREVHAGETLAKIPRELAKNKDITGGLPRVAELFEARVPKDQAIISEIDGIVEYGSDMKKKQRLVIRPEDSKGEEKGIWFLEDVTSPCMLVNLCVLVIH